SRAWIGAMMKSNRSKSPERLKYLVPALLTITIFCLLSVSASLKSMNTQMKQMRGSMGTISTKVDSFTRVLDRSYIWWTPSPYLSIGPSFGSSTPIQENRVPPYGLPCLPGTIYTLPTNLTIQRKSFSVNLPNELRKSTGSVTLYGPLLIQQLDREQPKPECQPRSISLNPR